MNKCNENFARRSKRVRYSVRKKSFGKPRLSVFRSERHIYAQIIDDACGKTLCSASTMEKTFQDCGKTANCDAAKKVGVVLAGKALSAGIKEVVFDRGGYNYHGRVMALATGARESGLVF